MPTKTVVCPHCGTIIEVEALSKREVAVLGEMAEGYTNRQISAHLVIALDTVKNHITAILRKLGETNRTAAVMRGLQDGLISLPKRKRPRINEIDDQDTGDG